MTEVSATYVKAHTPYLYSSLSHFKDRELVYSRDRQTQFIRICMPDEKEKWYSTNVKDPRFSQDIAELLKETYGDMAHIYALERVVSESSSKEEVKLWKAVLTLLDKEK